MKSQPDPSILNTNRILGDDVRDSLRKVAERISADEASFWMKVPDRESLVMVLNGNPRSQDMEIEAEQSLSDGLISLVFKRGDPFMDPHSIPTRTHSNKIDIEFEQSTHYMAIVPVTVQGQRVGVVSAVQFARVGDRLRKASEWGFAKDALEQLAELSSEIALKIDTLPS